jgi:undecaprenyl-diphosphatase
VEIIQSIILGIVQGLTEFLPVSSSAHLSVLPQLFGIKSAFLNSTGYDVALHAGTLCAILIYFRKKIAGLLAGFIGGIAPGAGRDAPEFKMSIYIIIATIPAVIAAVLFQKQIEGAFRNPVYTAAALIIFGIILWLADRTGAKKNGMEKMNAVDALIIGLAQALSIVPGVSRSGITITAGLLRGFKREDAAEFSFLLSAVAVIGAIVFELKKLVKAGSGAEGLVMLAGFAAALLSGMLAIRFLLAFVRKNSFLAFVIYRLALGAVIIFMVLKVPNLS